MPQIAVTIRNTQTSDYICHVYDLFGNGRREVDESPFPLAGGGPASEVFMVNANTDREGRIEYRCEGGPSLQKDVEDGEEIRF